MENQKLLSLNEEAIKNAILNLEKVDLEAVSIKQLEEKLIPLFAGLKVDAPQFFKENLFIYRGRIVSEKPKNFSEIRYPHEKFCREYGRCNDISKPMFYGSVGRSTPYSEIGANAGDFVVMSYWTNTEDIILNHVGFSQSVKEVLKSNRSLEDNYNFVTSTKQFNDLNRYVYDYLASKFAMQIDEKEKFKYKLSVAITNKLINGPFGGVMFPSIAMFGNSDNIVLKPEVVDSSLKLICVEYLKIEKSDIGGVQLKQVVLDTATEIAMDGEIQWTGRRLVFNSATKKIVATVQNGDYFMRDEDGKLLYPTSTGKIINQSLLQIEFGKQRDNITSLDKEINVLGPLVDYQIISKTNFDIQNKERYLSFYLPEFARATELVDGIIKQYRNFNANNETIIRIEDELTGDLVFSSENIELGNRIDIYSESSLNENFLITSNPGLILNFIKI